MITIPSAELQGAVANPADMSTHARIGFFGLLPEWGQKTIRVGIAFVAAVALAACGAKETASPDSPTDTVASSSPTPGETGSSLPESPSASPSTETPATSPTPAETEPPSTVSPSEKAEDNEKTYGGVPISTIKAVMATHEEIKTLKKKYPHLGYAIKNLRSGLEFMEDWVQPDYLAEYHKNYQAYMKLYDRREANGKIDMPMTCGSQDVRLQPVQLKLGLANNYAAMSTAITLALESGSAEDAKFVHKAIPVYAVNQQAKVFLGETFDEMRAAGETYYIKKYAPPKTTVIGYQLVKVDGEDQVIFAQVYELPEGAIDPFSGERAPARAYIAYSTVQEVPPTSWDRGLTASKHVYTFPFVSTPQVL